MGDLVLLNLNFILVENYGPRLELRVLLGFLLVLGIGSTRLEVAAVAESSRVVRCWLDDLFLNAKLGVVGLG